MAVGIPTGRITPLADNPRLSPCTSHRLMVFQRVDVYILCAEAECKTGCQYKKNNPLAFHLVWHLFSAKIELKMKIFIVLNRKTVNKCFRGRCIVNIIRIGNFLGVIPYIHTSVIP